MIRILIQTTLIALFITTSFSNGAHKVKMDQIKVENCDDAKIGIGLDWNGNDTVINPDAYKCYESLNDTEKHDFDMSLCQKNCTQVKNGDHICMNEPIIYEEAVPTSGLHRPVWVTYGDYLYMPPQRWVHAIEHGAAVFLYNPCADEAEIGHLKSIAKSCLRRHVITPYKGLPKNELFNIATYGCILRLNKIEGNEKKISDYLKENAINSAPEHRITEDGEYDFGLIQKASIISNLDDSTICPLIQ